MATQNSKKSKKATSKAKSAKVAAAKKPVKKAAVKAKTAVKAKPKAKSAPGKASAKAKPAVKAKPAPKKPVKKAVVKAGKAPKSGVASKSSKATTKVTTKVTAKVQGKPAPKKPQAKTGSAKPKVVAKPVMTKPVMAKPVIAKAKPKVQAVKPAVVGKTGPATGSKSSDLSHKPSVSTPVPQGKIVQVAKPKIVHTPAKPLAESRLKPLEKMSDRKEHKPVMPMVAEEPQKTRYSDKELEEFDQLIDQKLIVAREQLEFYLKQLEDMAENPDNKIKGLDDGLSSLESERVSSLASRQQKLIQHLENAKIRIKNKVYGICRETGKLISKERLRAVPHATLSIEAKQAQN